MPPAIGPAAFFMRKFKISDKNTTADIGLELIGDNLRELFIAAAEGLRALIREESGIEHVIAWREIILEAGDGEQLLVDWLSELIYIFDTDALIPVDIRIYIDTTAVWRLRGKVGFAGFDPSRHNAGHDIKAVTYYKLRITESNGRYGCHVVFDL